FGGWRQPLAQEVAPSRISSAALLPSRAPSKTDARDGSGRHFGQSRFRLRPRSIAEGQAVLPRFPTADQDTALAGDPYRLAAAERNLGHLDGMPAACQLGQDRFGIGGLDLQHPAWMREDARLLGGLLRVQAAVEDAMQKMRLPNRLIMPAHDAERHDGAAILDEHRRDDRV